MDTQFRKELQGFHKGDVTQYIDHLIAEYTKNSNEKDALISELNQAIAEKDAEIARLTQENDAMQKEKDSVSEALVAARQEAAAVKKQAEADCNAIRKNLEEEIALERTLLSESKEAVAVYKREALAKLHNLERSIEEILSEE